MKKSKVNDIENEIILLAIAQKAEMSALQKKLVNAKWLSGVSRFTVIETSQLLGYTEKALRNLLNPNHTPCIRSLIDEAGKPYIERTEILACYRAKYLPTSI